METRAAQPTVAILGRPNVGKSALFNRMTGCRDALVHAEAGVTRDRLYGWVVWEEATFRLIDTGGMEPDIDDTIKQGILDQVDRAIDESDLLLFVVDGKEGITVLDEIVAERLRPHVDRLLLVVNKVDDIDHAGLVNDFYGLGLGTGIWCSATHGLNVDAVLDDVVERLKTTRSDLDQDVDRPLRIAFVGRPNVGKSSSINHLIREERLVVTDVAGTTRGCVPVPLEVDGEPFILVDTAGIRRKRKVRSGVEKLSISFALRSIRMADIVVHLLDATEDLHFQDRHIAGLIQDARRACVVAVNKWDLAEEREKARKSWEDQFQRYLPTMQHFPRTYVSAKTGQGMKKVLASVKLVAENCRIQIPTNKLNKMIREATILHPPPSKGGRHLKISYVTQLRNRIATFVFKVNDDKLVHFSFQRFLENTLRRAGGFDGVPITLIFREK